MKTCSKCNVSQPLDCFPWNKDKRSPAGGRYGSWCKECHRQYSRPYRKTYYARNAEAVKEAQRAAHQADPSYLSRWRKANPELYRAQVNKGSAKRRAAKQRAAVPWADEAKIKAVYDHASFLRTIGVDCHVDHIVPLSGKTASGLHTHDNLQVLLADENMAKHNALPDDAHEVTPTWVGLAAQGKKGV